MLRYGLRDDQWERIGDLLPGREGSVDWARRQQAKMWELRTSTSFARLWQSQGKRQKGYLVTHLPQRAQS
jgi:hypothetical protein